MPLQVSHRMRRSSGRRRGGVAHERPRRYRACMSSTSSEACQKNR